MSEYKKVRISKIAATENPRHATPEREDYISGQDNGDVSIPIEYEITGNILMEPKMSERIIVYRETRNGVKVDGLFQSSGIQKIEDDLIHTHNSVYKIEYI